MNHYLIHTKRKNQKWICLIYYGSQLIKATKPNPDLGEAYHEAQTFVYQKLGLTPPAKKEKQS